MKLNVNCKYVFMIMVVDSVVAIFIVALSDELYFSKFISPWFFMDVSWCLLYAEAAETTHILSCVNKK